jgi:hypothetical protein
LKDNIAFVTIYDLEVNFILYAIGDPTITKAALAFMYGDFHLVNKLVQVVGT